MPRPIATPELIAKQMNQGPSSRSVNAPKNQSSTTPVGETPIVLALNQLLPYDKNPRTTKNPMYEEIKASVRYRGLDNPPQVTKRPGDTHYIICNGGNTRLQILKELYAETRDEKFNRITCLFRTWTDEAQILAGHLAENEMRGALTFIEKSQGVARLKTLFEEAQDGKKLTQVELAKRLKEIGYPVDRSHISRMLDCVDNLLPVIPCILLAGLGSPPIVKLLTLQKGLYKVYRQHSESPSDEVFEDYWMRIMSAFDVMPEKFKVDTAETALIGEMAKITGQPFQKIELDLSLLLRREGTEPPASIPVAPFVPEIPPSTKFPIPEPVAVEEEPAAEPINSVWQNAGARKSAAVKPTDTPTMPPPLSPPVAVTASLGQSSVSSSSEGNRQVTSSSMPAAHLLSLRKELFTAIREICMACDLDKLIVYDERAALGFRCVEHFNDPINTHQMAAGTLVAGLLRFAEVPANVALPQYSGATLLQALTGIQEIDIGIFKAKTAQDHIPERLPDHLVGQVFHIIGVARRIVDLSTHGGGKK
jgi:ParB family protein of integrating conjugative element (PFGI_1 class)